MDDLETLLKKLQQQAIRDAAAIDPKFAAEVEADRAELAAHEKMLAAQRLASTQTTGPIEQRKPPSDPDEPTEKEILARVNRAVIERRSL